VVRRSEDQPVDHHRCMLLEGCQDLGQAHPVQAAASGLRGSVVAHVQRAVSEISPGNGRDDKLVDVDEC
jgi:hypothetical protein